MTDYELLKEHYELVDFEILDGCWFYSEIGIFDEYIEKYKKIKVESEGAMRELAKLFLNNLYGKMASSKDSSFKLAYVKEDKTIGFLPVAEANKKQVIYLLGQLSQVMQETLPLEPHRKIIMVKIREVLYMQIQIVYIVTLHQKILLVLKYMIKTFVAGN